jgi:chlorophyll(ide) b reductase
VLGGVRRINNAGSNAYKYNMLSESTDADLINIVETNVLGVMLCCKEVRTLSAGALVHHVAGFSPQIIVSMQ